MEFLKEKVSKKVFTDDDEDDDENDDDVRSL